MATRASRMSSCMAATIRTIRESVEFSHLSSARWINTSAMTTPDLVSRSPKKPLQELPCTRSWRMYRTSLPWRARSQVLTLGLQLASISPPRCLRLWAMTFAAQYLSTRTCTCRLNFKISHFSRISCCSSRQQRRRKPTRQTLTRRTLKSPPSTSRMRSTRRSMAMLSYWSPLVVTTPQAAVIALLARTICKLRNLSRFFLLQTRP